MNGIKFVASLLAPLSASLVIVFLPAPLPGSPAKQTSANENIVETGRFRFFDTKQPAGEETYEITRDGVNLTLKSRLEMQLDEEKVSLTATILMRSDLTPARFEIKGKKPSGSAIDSTVEVRGATASVIESGRTRQVTLPGRFFTVGGYAPIALEMMLLRYWRRNQIKGPLRLVPNGEVTIELRGRDALIVNDKRVQLERYSLDGLTWGRQTIWLDSDGKLIAVVGVGGDRESTLPVVREGLETSLPFFLKRAAEDAINRLTAISSRLSPRRRGLLAIKGGTLIDGTGSAPVANSVVVIDGDRIIAVGPSSKVKIPKGATVVDARGKFLLPGLWDMHAHLFQAEFGPAYLAAGVTTVRDVGNEFEYVTVLRDAFRKGRGIGPWMLLAGYIEGKNEHSFDIQAGSPEEARAAVGRYKNAGFEQIKIRDQIKPDILKVISEEAHRLGMTLTGHVPRVMNALQAVEAGQDQISHINFVAPVFEFKRHSSGQGFVVDLEAPKTKRAIDSFKKHATVVDPTLAYMEMYVRSKETPITTFEPGFAKLPTVYAEHLNNRARDAGIPRNALAVFLSVVGVLQRAGIPVVAGTDVIVPGHSLHRELELFVQAGFTPMEAIQAATIVPARAMKLDRDVGTIEAGKRADLIVLDANPLESITNIRRIRSVIAQGRMFDCAQLWRAAGFLP